MSDIQIVLRRFKRTNEPKLELNNKQISFVPTEIYNFTQLEVLDLSNNKINSIDSKVSNLSNLKVLDLSNNSLMMLPESLLQLQNLQVLKLEGNPLSKAFEILTKQENQVQPRLNQALRVAFGLEDSLEECKSNFDSQPSQIQQNQGNLMKDMIGKDQEIQNLKKQNQDLQSQIQRLSISSNTGRKGNGTLQISAQTETVLDVNISDLEIGQQISQGGFSTVHKGYFRGCPVAIKKIFNPNITDELLDEINNEINMLVSLRHPQIVLLMAIVSKAPNLCIVTEFLPRGDLYSLLHRGKQRELPREKLVSIVQQIADIFNFIHKNKIVHRDLKSLNILLDNNHNVKLCDFGLARRFEDLNTSTSKFSGTPAYMSLELYQKKAYDHKVDVFAFGTLLWEIFAKEEPWAGLEPNEIMDKVQRDEPLPNASGITNQVMDLVKRCRNIRPERRPEFSEICEEVRNWY